MKPPPQVMGILNVTPDSFSDGGVFTTIDAAVEAGRKMVALGADIIDVGGESSRPGAMPVDADEEISRTIPVIEALADAGIRVSVDTTKSVVAEKGLAAGAQIVNDISGGQLDTEIQTVVAMYDATYIAMHMQGEPRTMQENPEYGNVVVDVTAALRKSFKSAVAAGVDRDKIYVDPGIGFGKSVSHNLALLGALPTMTMALGIPLVLGASRKSFIPNVLGDASAPGDREEATQALSVWGFTHGASIVRVHNVSAAAKARELIKGAAA